MNYLYSRSEVGCRCHWCGELVTNPSTVKAGKHLYCRNKGKCKMAHARAFRQYTDGVTVRSRSRPGLAELAGRNGNEIEGKPSRTSSPAIAPCRSPKGNARKRGK